MTLTTIVIFSHNRHELLNRSLEYYQNYSGYVIVLDSSSFPYQGTIPKNTTYINYPNYFLGDKIFYGLSQVNTDYAVLSADDDFLSFQGLEVGERFLNENLDHVSIQGRYINFDPTNSLKRSRPMYTHFDGYKNTASNIGDRMKKALEVQHLYALFRTDVLKECLSTTIGLPQITLVEICTALTSMIRGKHQVIPVFWMARDIARYTTYYNHSSIQKSSETIIVRDWETFMQSDDGNKFINQICKSLTGEYQEEQVRYWVNSAMTNLFNSSKGKKNLNSSKRSHKVNCTKKYCS